MTESQERSAGRHSTTHLFTVRVWQETYDGDAAEVRFHVKHVLSGESRLFRDGETLLQYLAMKLAETGDDNAPP